MKNSNLTDLEKAELHLGQALSVPILFGTVLLLLWTSLSWAAPSASSSWVKPRTVYYSAIFHTQTSKTPWRLVIGKNPSKRRIFAVIGAENGPLASCQLLHLEKDSQGRPLALELNCKNTQLASFTTNATLLWNHPTQGTASPTATLRFGTWLQGYEQKQLTVESDWYSKQAKRPPLKRLIVTAR